MKFFRHKRDNISGKKIEYAIPMLVIFAENAFHVVGLIFSTVFSVWGSGFTLTARTLSKLYFGGDNFVRHYLYALCFKHYIVSFTSDPLARVRRIARSLTARRWDKCQNQSTS